MRYYVKSLWFFVVYFSITTAWPAQSLEELRKRVVEQARFVQQARSVAQQNVAGLQEERMIAERGGQIAEERLRARQQHQTEEREASERHHTTTVSEIQRLKERWQEKESETQRLLQQMRTDIEQIICLQGREEEETQELYGLRIKLPSERWLQEFRDLKRSQGNRRVTTLGIPGLSLGIVPPQMPTGRRYRIGLSIDGGGVRGLIPALVLQRIEELVNRPIIEMVDMIGGTSIGGIIATGLAVAQDGDIPPDGQPRPPRHRASQLVDLIRNHKRDIFPERPGSALIRAFAPPYNSSALRELLRPMLGDAGFSDVTRDLLLTALSTTDCCPRIWTSRKVRTGECSNVLLREAALATSAAPTYLEAASVMYRW